MKPDEVTFLGLALTECANRGITEGPRGRFPRDIGRSLGIHPKRVRYLCEKWTKWGYEWGVSVDLGWFDCYSPEGKRLHQAAQEAVRKADTPCP